jgi:universal stress protein A
MNAKRILVPTDFSHYNDAALEYASTLAVEANAMLYIVHVDELGDMSAAMGEAAYLYAQSWDDPIRHEVRERLAQIKPALAGVRFEHHCLRGAPVTEILEFAEREKIDLIVMASHGRTGLSRLVMGSIAEGVVRRATCPVLIVKQPAVAQEMEGKVGAYVAHT